MFGKMGLDSSGNDVGNDFKFYTHYCKVKSDIIDQMIEENLPLVSEWWILCFYQAILSQQQYSRGW